jgi:hypothetical protein
VLILLLLLLNLIVLFVVNLLLRSSERCLITRTEHSDDSILFSETLLRNQCILLVRKSIHIHGGKLHAWRQMVLVWRWIASVRIPRVVRGRCSENSREMPRRFWEMTKSVHMCTRSSLVLGGRLCNLVPLRVAPPTAAEAWVDPSTRNPPFLRASSKNETPINSP